MPNDEGQFAVKQLLDGLREKCGDAEFGYRMQGLLAHVLARLGAVIIEVNAQGHPDIKARMADQIFLIQVKSAQHASTASTFQLSSTDLAGIMPGSQSKGYLAFLDCADPVSWILIEAPVAKQFLSRCMPIAALRAAQARNLSDDCTAEFLEMVLSVRKRLSMLTFPLLVRYVLAGTPI